MKRSVLMLLWMAAAPVALAQFPVSTDSIYIFIRSNSIHRNKVNWPLIDLAFQNQLEDAASLKDTMRSFVSVLAALHDVHSQVYLNNEYYGHYPPFDDSTLARLKPLNDKASSLTNQIFTTMLPGSIAYIRVPSTQVYDKQQINAYAKSLFDSVDQYSTKRIKGFIIDLRLNGGGNVYPMLTGLSALLGDNTIAYETDIADNVTRKWEIRQSNFMIGGYQATQLKVKPGKGYSIIPVALLTGPVTKSSGSMTAIAFKQRPNSIFIGEPTADGYTTSNGYFQFAPNLVMNFATHFVADRKMNIYKTTVDPDIRIHRGDNFENLLQDEKIQAALRWFKQY